MQRPIVTLALTLTAGLGGAPVHAQALVAVRNLPAGAIIAPEDIALDMNLAAGLADPDAVLGRESRIALYEGRPIRASDMIAPTLVKRNQLIALTYLRGGLAIATEGRALGKGAAGEVIRVMNVASRSTVSARIADDGSAVVVAP